MANLSYLPISAGAAGRLVFRNIHDQVVIASAASSTAGGVKKRYRVRRSDFSSQENYELALRTALREANYAIKEDAVQEAQPVKKAKAVVKVADTAIKISAVDFAALQQASEMDEIRLLKMFIDIIESE